ncbi:hypothetical protein [Frankia tisae]|uniref:hypothetical protein n=1 Tax=Frankia tisae TaxID=2950104 RepID=UPI0021C21235|nr:hypothetical protein [Frankia tisae]
MLVGDLASVGLATGEADRLAGGRLTGGGWAGDDPGMVAHTGLIGDRRIVVDLGVTLPLAQLPPFSIALDGMVQGPAIDADTHRLSFDHHGGCVRLVTAATCQQVADALLLGLDPAPYTVYVNDVDADTCLALALLVRPELLGAGQPGSVVTTTRDLVLAVAGRDAHGPAYPVRHPELLAAFSARVPVPPAGTVTTAAEGFSALAGAVAAIAELVVGLSAQRPAAPVPRPRPENASRSVDAPPARFTVARQGSGWVMLRAAIGARSFEEAYAAGHSRVVVFGELPDGSVAYTVAKRSDLVDFFPVGPASRPGTILAALAAREPGWGGGSSIGGAPRHRDGRRSALSPDEVFAIVETVVAAERAGLRPN